MTSLAVRIDRDGFQAVCLNKLRTTSSNLDCLVSQVADVAEITSKDGIHTLLDRLVLLE